MPNRRTRLASLALAIVAASCAYDVVGLASDGGPRDGSVEERPDVGNDPDGGTVDVDGGDDADAGSTDLDAGTGDGGETDGGAQDAGEEPDPCAHFAAGVPRQLDANGSFALQLGGDDADHAYGVALLPGGDIVVAGLTQTAVSEAFLVRITKTGEVTSCRRFAAPGKDSWFDDVATSLDGDILAVGTTYGSFAPGVSAKSSDIIVVRVDDSGELVSRTQWDGTTRATPSADFGHQAAITPDGTNWIAGVSEADAPVNVPPGSHVPTVLRAVGDGSFHAIDSLTDDISSLPTAIAPWGNGIRLALRGSDPFRVETPPAGAYSTVLEILPDGTVERAAWEIGIHDASLGVTGIAPAGAAMALCASVSGSLESGSNDALVVASTTGGWSRVLATDTIDTPVGIGRCGADLCIAGHTLGALGISDRPFDHTLDLFTARFTSGGTPTISQLSLGADETAYDAAFPGDGIWIVGETTGDSARTLRGVSDALVVFVK